MALNASILENELLEQSKAAANGQKITYGDFVRAMEKYALGIQFPPPTGVPIAAGILKKLLDAIPTTPPLPIATPIIKLAVQLFALGISQGAPIGTGLIFPTIPPPGQPSIDSILSQPNSQAQAAKQLSVEIHMYMLSGQYDAFGIPPSNVPAVPGYTPWT